MNKIIVMTLLLSGCATSTDMYLADGSKGYSISCNGSANSVSSCYQKASDLCGSKGYVTYGREGESNPMGMTTGAVNQGNGVIVSNYGMIVTRSLLIRCKE